MFDDRRFLKFLAIICLFSPQYCFATLVKPMGVKELSKNADCVFWAAVKEIHVDPQSFFRKAELRLKENIESEACVREETTLRGPIYVRLENRYIPSSQSFEKVVGAPELKVGEEILVFLSRAKNKEAQNRGYSVTGFHQGIYRIFKDSLGRSKALSFREMPATGAKNSQVVDVKNLQEPSQRNQAPLLSDLMNQIRDQRRQSNLKNGNDSSQ